MLLVQMLVVLRLGYCINTRRGCFKFLALCMYVGTHAYDAIHIYLFLDACVSVFSNICLCETFLESDQAAESGSHFRNKPPM